MTGTKTLFAVTLCASFVGCGASHYTMVPSQTKTVANVKRVMRGATRIGCDASGNYDDMMGLFIDCKDGRVALGTPAGGELLDPGGPLEVMCTKSQASKEKCEAIWKELLTEGKAPCDPGDQGAGCGELKCTSTANVAAGAGPCDKLLAE